MSSASREVAGRGSGPKTHLCPPGFDPPDPGQIPCQAPLSQGLQGELVTSAMMRLASSLMLVVVAVECGTHLDEAWFRWRGGRVPFYFQVYSIEWCPHAYGDGCDNKEKLGGGY